MKELFENSRDLVAEVDIGFIRPLANPIDWSRRLNGIIGARGTGKTTVTFTTLVNNIWCQSGGGVHFTG